MSKTPPAHVVEMSETVHLNAYRCWVQDVDGEWATNEFTWAEITADCMTSLDVGEDGIPVITFGLFGFELNLHASLFDLVSHYITCVSNELGIIYPEDRDEAARLIEGLENAAAMIRSRMR